MFQDQLSVALLSKISLYQAICILNLNHFSLMTRSQLAGSNYIHEDEKKKCTITGFPVHQSQHLVVENCPVYRLIGLIKKKL